MTAGIRWDQWINGWPYFLGSSGLQDNEKTSLKMLTSLSTSGKAWLPPSCSLVLKLPLVVSSRETMITVSLQAVTLWFQQKLTQFAQTMTAHCGIVRESSPQLQTPAGTHKKKKPNGNLTNNCDCERQCDNQSATL